MMCNEAKCVPEEYTKKLQKKKRTQENKYGGRNKDMFNREDQGIRGTDCCNQRA